MELEVRHLRVLVAVADHGSATKAAAALGLSQPSLSSQLRRIEKEMGAPLFERSRDGMVPTELGRTVLAKARLVLADMAELRGQTSVAGADAIELRIGSMPGPMLSAIIPHIERLHCASSSPLTGAHPHLGPLTVRSHTDGSAAALIRMVQQNRLDATLLLEIHGYDALTPEGLRRVVLVPAEPVFIALPERHPLAAKDVIDLADLAEERWVCDPTDDYGTAYLRKACRDSGFEPIIAYEVSDTGTARGFVSSGQCVFLAQAPFLEGHGIVVRPLLGDPLVQRHELICSERCPVDRDLLVRAAAEAYLELVDRNPSFYRWWADHRSFNS
jgi:DNA-binding transcriptional LysR family regulator